jgi:hypothetical protein
MAFGEGIEDAARERVWCSPALFPFFDGASAFGETLAEGGDVFPELMA